MNINYNSFIWQVTLNELIKRIISKFDLTDVWFSNPKSKDKIVILKEVGDKKIKIGINIAGDNSYWVKKSIELLEKENCDIVVCPTKASIKTNDGSISTIQKFYKRNKERITLVPLFKIMQKGNEDELKSNDDIIMNQLLNYL